MAEQSELPAGEISTSNAMKILRRHSDHLCKSLVRRPAAIARELWKEEVLVEDELDHIEETELTSKQSSMLFSAMRKTVAAIPTKLKEIASVLLMFEEVAPLARQILDDCNAGSELIQNNSASKKDVNVPIIMSPNEKCFFNEMRMKRTVLFYSIRPKLTAGIPSLKELVEFIATTWDELEPQIANASTVEEVLNVVQSHCTIVNVSYVKLIAEFFKVDEVVTEIETFSQEVNNRCEGLLLKYCMNESFRDGYLHQLKCNTIEFFLSWDPSEKELKDISSILWKAFDKYASNIKISNIREGNSIIVVCHAPHTMMAMLMMRAKRNIDILVKEGVMSLFVGHYTVLDHKSKEQMKMKHLRNQIVQMTNEIKTVIEQTVLMDPDDSQELKKPAAITEDCPPFGKLDDVKIKELSTDEATEKLQEHIGKLDDVKIKELLTDEATEKPQEHTEQRLILNTEIAELKAFLDTKNQRITTLKEKLQERDVEMRISKRKTMQIEDLEHTIKSLKQVINHNVKSIGNNRYKVIYIPATSEKHQLQVEVHDIQTLTLPMILMVPSPLGPGRWINSINNVPHPFDVAIASDGYIAITEHYNHCISIYDTDGVKINTIGEYGTSEGQLGCPCGVAFTPDNEIVVADRNNCRIQKFARDGRFLQSTSGGQGSNPGEFCRVLHGLAVHPHDGKIYVCDGDNSRVQVLNPDLTFSYQFGSLGMVGGGRFQRCFSIDIDKDGFVYVADKNNFNVQKFTSEGTFIEEFGKSRGPDSKDQPYLSILSCPNGIAVDDWNEKIYVSSFNTNCITEFDKKGNFLRQIGEQKMEEMTIFNHPIGLAIDKQKKLLYICDHSNNRVLIY